MGTGKESLKVMLCLLHYHALKNVIMNCVPKMFMDSSWHYHHGSLGCASERPMMSTGVRSHKYIT